MWEAIWESIKAGLARVWNLIKKICVKIISFFSNIVSFFKDPNRLRKLQADKNTLAISIKEKLDNGDYQVVNCLFDKENSEIVDAENDAQVITSDQLDAETRKSFGREDMLVLQ